MTKEKIMKPEEESLGVAMGKTERFLEEHSKTATYCIIGLLVLGAAIFGYKKLISEPRIEKAAELIAEAENRFAEENPDFQLALEGDANGAGFLEVIEQYGSTPSGNLAKHCAGICYYKMGDLENAAAYLKKYKAVKGLPGAIVNAQNLGLQGDIALEQGNYAAAVALYEKAVAAADNNYTAPLYLRKAGIAEQMQGNKAAAEKFFQRILTSYPASMEAREAEKLMGANN